MKSSIEETLAYQIRVYKLPEPVRELRFHPVRKWRFDFAFPEQKVAAECEGAIYVNGRHTRGSGFELDCEKYNAATSMGWRVFKFTRRMVDKGVAIAQLQEVLRG
jgi:very-short-patch-repair endonuclease